MAQVLSSMPSKTRRSRASHSGQPLSCPLCDRAFTGIGPLATHKKTCFTTLDEFAERSTELVAIDSASECWSWLNPDGLPSDVKYRPRLVRDGRRTLLARVLLELKLGRKLELTELACHTCDRPHCVNPGHLWAGTARENSVDMVAKKRQVGGGWTSDAWLKGPHVRWHVARKIVKKDCILCVQDGTP